MVSQDPHVLQLIFLSFPPEYDFKEWGIDLNFPDG